MGKRYLDIKENSLESSVFNILHGIQEEAREKKKITEEVELDETNKNDKSDDGDGLDAVQPKAVKKKFKDRKDKDVDNDGDVDDSDKYLHKRRKAVSKAITKKEGNAFGMALKAAKDKGEKTFVVSGKTYNVKEDVGLDEGTWALPRTPKEKAALKKLLSKPLKAKDASDKLYDIIGDDQLADDVGDFAEKHPNDDVREIVRGHMKRMGIKEDTDLDESKMSQMHQMIKDKKSPEQIAKAMKLDVKTVKALMASYEQMVPESFEIGTEKYLKHTVETTPGQKAWTEVVTKKATSMRETLAKMWDVDEGKNVFEKDAKKDLTSRSKSSNITMTGKKVAGIDTTPTIKEKKK
jgi:hypothetical protein